MIKAIPMEDWLRGCIYHDGRHGYVTLPIDKVHQIANYIQRTRRSGMDGLIDLEVVEADRKTEPMMTNLEWLKTLSAEELADWLYDEWLHHLQYRWSSSRGGLIIWLKDHKTKSQTCSVNGRPYTDCCNCEYFKCTADEPQTERSNDAE